MCCVCAFLLEEVPTVKETNSSMVVSASRDNSIRIWDASTGKQLSQLEGHTDNVASVAYSPDGSWDKSIRVTLFIQNESSLSRADLHWTFD